MCACGRKNLCAFTYMNVCMCACACSAEMTRVDETQRTDMANMHLCFLFFLPLSLTLASPATSECTQAQFQLLFMPNGWLNHPWVKLMQNTHIQGGMNEEKTAASGDKLEFCCIYLKCNRFKTIWLKESFHPNHKKNIFPLTPPNIYLWRLFNTFKFCGG